MVKTCRFVEDPAPCCVYTDLKTGLNLKGLCYVDLGGFILSQPTVGRKD